ncbi:phage head closure protein [Enterovirga aerilata]|uniref:Phage head closure protein n=1 Tax=Enterovirga aerilata TaxID=2730920 RepID=A0A849I5P5_9HYPH|nr:phage head closure protein [Enterovirga sp. DB1703]NNM72651.1 phage head closure protein [Enterovirga sp. DB1703]
MAPARKPIGSRDRRFTLELPLETPDGFGGVIRTWQPGPLVWGAIEHLSASERSRADRAEAAITHRVTLRHREGVSERMRLLLGPRRFRIRSAADPDGSRRELVCLVEEIRP